MNSIVHFEIQADDPLRAMEFYQKVFDWNIEKMHAPLEYWLIEMGDDLIGGAIKHREKPVIDESANAYVCIINVASIDEIAKKIISAGGSVTSEKTMIPTIGWHLYCKDTEGNVFGLIQYLQKQ